MKLSSSAGAVESLAHLRDPKSGVSVALVPGGITTKEDSPDLVSLGTVFYQPLWMFSRDHLPHDRVKFRRRRVSFGPEGSSSRVLSLVLLGCARWIDQKSTTLLALRPAEAAQALIRGEIDAAIFLDGWESPVVQSLLSADGVSLESIPSPDAFVRIYPYLNKLALPAGAIALFEPRPPTDVVLIGPKSSLVERNDLHAALQYRLLEAAVEIHSMPSMFRTAGQFPAPESVDLTQPLCARFLQDGVAVPPEPSPFVAGCTYRAAVGVAYSLGRDFISAVPACAFGLRLARAQADLSALFRTKAPRRRSGFHCSGQKPGGSHRTTGSLGRPSKPPFSSVGLHADAVRVEVTHWSGPPRVRIPTPCPPSGSPS